MTRCALFDLGGTLWDDWPAEQEHWRICCELLTEAGRPCSLEDFNRDCPDLIRSYCPSLTRALVWRFSGHDSALAAGIRREASARTWELLEDDEQLARLYPLWPGVRKVLDELSGHMRLAVVSMHGSRVRPILQRMGISHYFEELALCDEQGFYKPDPRIILSVVDRLGVKAADCMMIGDRIDNDIWPANVLGLKTVWLRVHPYDIQQPRYETDQPDLIIDKFAHLPEALRTEGWL